MSREYSDREREQRAKASRAYEQRNKEQRSKASRDWKRRNKAHVKAKLTEWLAKNKKHRAEWAHARYLKNIDKVKAYDAAKAARPDVIAKRLADRPKKKAYMAEWIKKNPGVGRAASQKRYALKRGLSVGCQKMIADWINSWNRKRSVRCYWCGNPFAGKACHADHIIPLSKGGIHAVENMCVSCAGCNQKKHAKPLAVWNLHLAEPVLL